MDPQITLTDMLTYLRDNDLIEAQRALDALLTWHKKQGFLPDLGKALDALLADA